MFLVNTFPTFRLLSAEIIAAKFVSVATSRKYVVAPTDEFQLAVNDVWVTIVPATATGGGGVATTVVTEMMFELPLVPPTLLPLTL